MAIDNVENYVFTREYTYEVMSRQETTTTSVEASTPISNSTLQTLIMVGGIIATVTSIIVLKRVMK